MADDSRTSRAVRREEALSDTRVIVMSGTPMPEENEIAREGFDGFIGKPFRVKDLMALLGNGSGVSCHRTGPIPAGVRGRRACPIPVKPSKKPSKKVTVDPILTLERERITIRHQWGRNG